MDAICVIFVFLSLVLREITAEDKCYEREIDDVPATLTCHGPLTLPIVEGMNDGQCAGIWPLCDGMTVTLTGSFCPEESQETRYMINLEESDNDGNLSPHVDFKFKRGKWTRAVANSRHNGNWDKLVELVRFPYTSDFTVSITVEGHRFKIVGNGVEMGRVERMREMPLMSIRRVCAYGCGRVSSITIATVVCDTGGTGGECYVKHVKDSYLGHLSHTVSGRVCQRWDSKTPHKPRQDYGIEWFPGDGGKLPENFCRVVDEPAPWCYTTDPAKRWEFCDVPECEDEMETDNEPSDPMDSHSGGELSESDHDPRDIGDSPRLIGLFGGDDDDLYNIGDTPGLADLLGGGDDVMESEDPPNTDDTAGSDDPPSSMTIMTHEAKLTAAGLDAMTHEEKLTAAGSSCSMFCLLITVIIQVYNGNIKTTPGKIMVSLSVSLFSAQFLFMFVDYPFGNDITCKVIAILDHLFWLLVLSWSNIMVLDLLWTISNATNNATTDATTDAATDATTDATTDAATNAMTNATTNAINDAMTNAATNHIMRTSYVLYATLASAIPISIIITCIVLDSQTTFFQYGVPGNCWINYGIAILYSFMTPVAASVTLNIGLLVYMFVLLYRLRQSTSEDAFLVHRRSAIIGLKLASVMDLTWIFGVVGGLLGNAILLYIFTFFNSFQGVTVFFGVTYNHSSVKAWLKARCGRMNRSQSGTSDTVTPPTTVSNPGVSDFQDLGNLGVKSHLEIAGKCPNLARSLEYNLSLYDL